MEEQVVDIFAHNDYRDIVRVLVNERKRFDPDLTFQSLAKACRITKTYLSRVLSGKGDLSDDQIYDAAQYLKVSSLEKKYLTTLHAYQRSISKVRKRELRDSLQAIKNQSSKTEENIKRLNTLLPESELLSRYFLEPEAQLLHMLLYIKEFQLDPTLASNALNISASDLDKHLRLLVEAGFVSRFSSSYMPSSNEPRHLPKESAIYPAYIERLRLLTLARLNRMGDDQKYSFSAIFVADEPARRKIQKMFMQFLDDAQKVAAGSKKRGAFQMNFDLFRWWPK